MLAVVESGKSGSTRSVVFQANYTEGVRAIQTYEAANLPVVNPSLLDDRDAALFASSDWDVLNLSPERLTIDTCLFNALELTKGERDAVHEGVSELIGDRARRSGRRTPLRPRHKT